jgi:hypothetical protein
MTERSRAVRASMNWSYTYEVFVRESKRLGILFGVGIVVIWGLTLAPRISVWLKNAPPELLALYGPKGPHPSKVVYEGSSAQLGNRTSRARRRVSWRRRLASEVDISGDRMRFPAMGQQVGQRGTRRVINPVEHVGEVVDRVDVQS